MESPPSVCRPAALVPVPALSAAAVAFLLPAVLYWLLLLEAANLVAPLSQSFNHQLNLAACLSNGQAPELSNRKCSNLVFAGRNLHVNRLLPVSSAIAPTSSFLFLPFKFTYNSILRTSLIDSQNSSYPMWPMAFITALAACNSSFVQSRLIPASLLCFAGIDGCLCIFQSGVEFLHTNDLVVAITVFVGFDNFVSFVLCCHVLCPPAFMDLLSVVTYLL